MKETVVVLNNIRSSENVGSIFRTCDAVGVSRMFLCGYTPAPLDRFGRENKSLTKASLGAERFVKWERVESFKVASEKLKEEGFKIVGVEQDEEAITYTKIHDREKLYNLAFVFGNETEGLSKKDLKLCDLIVEIPMRGSLVKEDDHPRNLKQGKESLNVAVSVGIILYSLNRFI